MFQTFQCAYDRWLPGIGDEMIVSWINTAGYFITAGLAVLVLRAGHERNLAGGTRVDRFWWIIAVVFVLLGFNKQLDLHTLLSNFLKCASIAGGWYAKRATLQAIFVVAVLAGGVALATAALVHFWSVHRRIGVAVLGIAMVAAFVVIRAVSFHHIERLFGPHMLGPESAGLVELVGIIFVSANALWLVAETKPAVASALQETGLTGRFNLRPHEIVGCAMLGLALALFLLPQTPNFTAIATGYLMFTMLVVMFIDSRHMIIPDAFSLPAIPLGLAAAASAFPQVWFQVLIDHGLAAAVAGSILLALRWSYHRLRGIEGLGLGDVKLAAAAGAWVGLELLPLTCLLATVSALVAVLARRLLKPGGDTAMSAAVPFGSFIAPSIVIMWLVALLTP